MSRVRVSPVGLEGLDALAELFGQDRATRHCWCTAFCSSSQRFALGWYGGGNRRRFESMAADSAAPMGVLGTLDDVPVGWCACGPRSRYAAASTGRSSLLTGFPVTDDERVWLIPCLIIARAQRSAPMVLTMLRAAVELATDRGATAVDAWPTATGVRSAALSHVGREVVFSRLGFRRVVRVEDRALMRLDLSSERESSDRPLSTRSE